jgi:4-amino-4-deoxy-L-arabinose transferase-like glycosyltransferase
MAAIFVIAVLLRTGYANDFPPEAVVESVDAQGYHQIARNLLAGHGFSLQAEAPFRPDAIRTPLYPAFIAAVYFVAGPRPQTVAVAQALLDAGTALASGALAATLAARLGDARRATAAGLAAAAAYALMPGQIRYTNALLTETALAFLLTLAALAFASFAARPRARTAAAAGVLLGLAILCKPNVAPLPVLFALGAAWIAWRSTRRAADRLRAVARTAGLLLAASVLVCLPWVFRNWLVFGRPLLSTAFQDNLARVSAPATLARVRGETVAPWTPRWEALYAEIVAAAADRFAWPPGELATLDTATYERRQQEIAAVAGDIVRTHPADAVAAHLTGIARSWLPTEYGFWYEYLAGTPWSALPATTDAMGRALALVRAGDWRAALDLLIDARWNRLPALARVLWYGWGVSYVAGFVCLAAGLWALRRETAVAVLAATIVIVTLVPGPIAYVRFRVPVVGLLVALEVAGALAIAQLLARRLLARRLLARRLLARRGRIAPAHSAEGKPDART